MKYIILFVISTSVAATGIAAHAHDSHKLGWYWRLDNYGNNYTETAVGYGSDRSVHYASFKHRSNHHWESKGQYRTRKFEPVNRHIAIGGRISAIRITAAKRNTFIREAWIEYGNGQLERVPALEGRLSYYNSLKVRLHKKRNIRKLHLKVKSRGHQRSYFDVEVRRTI
jgi:hypothetical protein